MMATAQPKPSAVRQPGTGSGSESGSSTAMTPTPAGQWPDLVGFHPLQPRLGAREGVPRRRLGLRLFGGDPAGGANLIGIRELAPLSPSASTSATFTWTPARDGVHALHVIADYGN